MKAEFTYEKDVQYKGLNLTVRGQNFDEPFKKTQGGLEFNAKIEIVVKSELGEAPWGVNVPLMFSDIPNEKVQELTDKVSEHISIYDPQQGK